VKALNPDAVLIETDRSRVPAQAILGTGLFDFETAHQHPMWAKELYGFADHVPETEEYGVSSFVYRARRPFDPGRVHSALTGDLPGVIRAKGHFWIATRPNWVAEFSLAGAMSSVTPLGGWWITVPQERWPTDPESVAKVQERWCEPWGDRRQEIVFIGSGMDREGIEAMLDAALVPEWEFVPERWAGLADPFPAWGRKTAA
jgi:G3E family GTPase